MAVYLLEPVIRYQETLGMTTVLMSETLKLSLYKSLRVGTLIRRAIPYNMLKGKILVPNEPLNPSEGWIGASPEVGNGQES